ncbi:hypothetical protein SprV_0301214800 [Sparganum proliferum]
MPNTFKHVELILEKEITLVRERLFHKNGSIQKAASELPEPSGPIVTLQKKVFVPVKENPNQMEQDLGCKIMVRGKGSMRDKRKEDQNRGKPNWEHLQEELHVLVSVEDYESRAEVRLQRAVNAIQIFLEQGVKTPEDKDVLKQTQLMELAVLNDKDRQQAQVQQMTQQQQQQLILQHQYMALLSSPSAMAAAAAVSQNPHLLRLQAAANSLGGLAPGAASSLLLQNSVMPASCIVPAAAAAAAVAAAAAPPHGAGVTTGTVSNATLQLSQQTPLALQQLQQSAMFQPFNPSQQAAAAAAAAAAASSLSDPFAAFLSSFGSETSSGQLGFTTTTPSVALPFLSAASAASRDIQHSNMLGEYTQSATIDGNAGAMKLKANSGAAMKYITPQKSQLGLKKTQNKGRPLTSAAA